MRQPGEFSVNTPAGELSVAPVSTAAHATQSPTLVNSAAAVFAETAPATDTFVRPDALGAAALLQLRNGQAPSSFAWELGIGPNQRLELLSDGSVAVVEVPSSSPVAGELGEGIEPPEESEVAAESSGEAGDPPEAAEEALENEVGEEGVLERLSAAPQTSTLPITPKAGELQPQRTKVQYEDGTEAIGPTP